MKKKFIKTPLKGVYVHGAKDVGTRTVNLLMGEHAGEYVRGDIMDANAVVQAFDELKGNVDNNHDSLEEIVDELHNLRDATDQSFEVFQEKAEEETASRIQGDKTLDEKIDQKERESKERDNTLQQNIDTEKQERINADTQLRNDLTAEVNRAKASENTLSENIKAEATKRENDDNTIKDNLNAEVTRATAKENEIKAEVDVINGDSTTEGSFRKAIADVVGAAPEAYDTLKEIADKLNENDDLHAAINDAIATKADKVALNEEITRAKAAEAENKAEIAAEAARAKGVEGDNALAIQNEASRATLAENAINEALNTEVERAKGQEAYLQNLVNTKADTTALEGAKTELDKKISDETTRATEEEDELRSLITTEQNRATASEKSIADDLNGKLAKKADTTTLNEQVDTLNAAISAKQDAGKYIPYEGYGNFVYKVESGRKVQFRTINQTGTATTIISGSNTAISQGNQEAIYSRNGVTLSNGDNNHVLTSNASTIDIREYAKKDELPTVPTAVSQLTNDSNFITSADIDFTPYATIEALTAEITARTEALTALEAKVTANTSAITNINVSKGIPYDPSVPHSYQTDKSLGVKSGNGTAIFGPESCITMQQGDNNANTMAINYSGISLKTGDYSFALNPGGIAQVGSGYKFNVDSSNGVKFSVGDGTICSKIDMYGLDAKVGDSYTKCGSPTGLDIKGFGPYSGTQTTLNPDKLLMKRSDDRQVMLTPDQLLMNGTNGFQVMLTPDQLLMKQRADSDLIFKYNIHGLQVGSDSRGIKLGPLLFSNGGAGIWINSKSYLQQEQLILNGDTKDGVGCIMKLDLNGISFYRNDGTGESVISRTGKMISGFDIQLTGSYSTCRTLSEALESIYSYKQDKITPTTELDLTSIDTADIESLRSIVKALATELNTLGLIKLKSAE